MKEYPEVKCACGCGELVDFTKGRKNKKFVHGHAIRVNNAGGAARKGKEPWNKGVPRTDEEKSKMSENRRKAWEEKTKPLFLSGEWVSPFYIDGRFKNDPNSTFNQYGGEFTKELKLVVRHRDNFTCQQCDKKKSITVHHIDEDKLNNSLDNLITLCKTCHGKFHTRPKSEQEKLTEFYKEVINNGRVSDV